MTVRIAINGFGRIGRNILRALVSSGRDDIEIVAINDLGPVETSAHLLRYDSIHGRFPGPIAVDGRDLIVAGRCIAVSQCLKPGDLRHGNRGIDIVFECTGLFTTREKASVHLAAGAKRVLVSAPVDDADATIVYGVNHQALKADHLIVSNASCTTNCLAPLALALNEAVGIEHGLMTTIHSYTNDQPSLDQMHRDLYRARAAALSMIPTATGAARAVGLVLPDLKGRLDGVSIRVPTPNVSAVDFKFVARRGTTIAEVNEVLTAAAAGPLKGILAVTEAPNVSIDFNQDPASSTVALDQTRVMAGTLVRILSWYDNEWGFSNRMNDTGAAMARLLARAA